MPDFERNALPGQRVANLSDLARVIGVKMPAEHETLAGIALKGLAADSRLVQPGYVFFALPGTLGDGMRFARSALEQGAVAVVGKGARPEHLPAHIPYLEVREARVALSRAAAWFYPNQPETMVAVTGTAGKTSVAEFTRQLFADLGHKAASLGTLGITTAEGTDYGALTTPDPVSLHRSLHRLALAGVSHGCMEASSHGLDQHRLDGVRLKAAGFTNLGRDHLDYHPDIAAYFDAKLRLFQEILPLGAPVVINLDGHYGDKAAVAAGFAGRSVFTIGRNGREIAVRSVTPAGFGQQIVAQHAGQNYRVHLPLMGGFQSENALVAAGFALVLGEKPPAVFAALEGLKGVPGRLERVGVYNKAPVFVDYAHKPEALSYALAALRPAVSGRLVLVFGCGGDRDKGKRPLMGAIAARAADRIYVTDDNPRSETPAHIRAEILAACPHALEIGDRAAAIEAAITDLQPGDALLIAGKGHETGQIIGDQVYPFSDKACVETVLEGFL